MDAHKSTLAEKILKDENLSREILSKITNKNIFNNEVIVENDDELYIIKKAK